MHYTFFVSNQSLWTMKAKLLKCMKKKSEEDEYWILLTVVLT